MGFSLGIVGLPNVGKTTIFNAITSICAEASNYPFCTIEPNKGVVPVKDERLDKIMEIIRTESYIPTSITFIDIAGLVKGANKGEGLGNKFLSHIREVDGIVHIVRCFEIPDIVHVEGDVNPIRDIEIIDTELALADLEVLERRKEKLIKSHTAEAKRQLQIIEELERIVGGKGDKNFFDNLSDDERKFIKEINLITLKPSFYVANIDEKELEKKKYLPILTDYAKKRGKEVCVVCGRLEEEIGKLSEEEKKEMLSLYSIEEDAIHKIIRYGYSLLNLITFFTTARKELKAWTIEKGTKAIKAAGKIHTDMERGFIRAEVIHYDDLLRAGSEARARELGFYHLQGKDYEIQDGDIVYFRFNV
ncbi:MAG: redox-regulated ATPase YchF [Proteobacteria bacterium]|nr:redox-regulated ATPase YchF [Pseudomonadota bacterium]